MVSAQEQVHLVGNLSLHRRVSADPLRRSHAPPEGMKGNDNGVARERQERYATVVRGCRPSTRRLQQTLPGFTQSGETEPVVPIVTDLVRP